MPLDHSPKELTRRRGEGKEGRGERNGRKGEGETGRRETGEKGVLVSAFLRVSHSRVLVAVGGVEPPTLRL
jgi:hypothetical protein